MPQSNNLIGQADNPMDRHNRRIRKILSDCDGEGVRHTGKGIFARFNLPDDAMQGLLKESLGLIGTNAERAQSF